MSEKIEVSEKGIRFSYKRFLSDSATGYIFCLILISAYYGNISIPFVGIEMQDILKPKAGKEIKILVALLLFMLSTPIGISFNAISFFMFGYVERCIVLRLFKNNFICSYVNVGFLLKKIQKHFDLDLKRQNEFLARLDVIEEYLIAFHPQIMSSIDHVRGIKIFIRSLNGLFCSMMIFMIFSLIDKWYSTGFFVSVGKSALFIILALALVTFLILLASAIAFYFKSHFLQKAYVLSLADEHFQKFYNEISKEFSNAKKKS